MKRLLVIFLLIAVLFALPVFAEGTVEKAAAYDELIAEQEAAAEKYAASFASKIAQPNIKISYSRGTTRPAVIGKNVVMAGDSRAAAAGMEILMNGGTAFDAALAIAGVQSVVEPNMTNILGGDSSIIVYNAERDEISVYNGMGWAPYKATVDFYLDEGGIPLGGPLSVQLPGAWAGWMLMLEENGTLPLSDILAPVIEASDESVYDQADYMWRYANTQFANDAFKGIYQKADGSWVKNGEVVSNSNYSNTLKELAEAAAKGSTLAEGFKLASDYFYRGPIAEKIVAWSDAEGGLFTIEDFNEFYAEKQEPWSTTYGDFEVFVCPPTSQGPAMLEALNIIENFDVKAMGDNTPEYLDLVIQALNVALNDRNMFYGDMRFVDIPDYLFTKDYAAKVASQLNLGTAMTSLPDNRELVSAYDEKGKDTTYMYVADQYGNVVSCTHSLCNAFGSLCVAGDTGILLNNRMIYFLLDEERTNGLEPHKRTMQTISPIIGTKDGEVNFMCGTPGADVQVQAVMQVILHYMAFGVNNAQKAIEQPRVVTAHPAGLMNPNEFPRKLSVQSGFSTETIYALEAMGYVCDNGNTTGFGNSIGFAIKDANGYWHAGADPQSAGYAFGW